MVDDLLKDLKKLRNEMVQANWPAQRLSDIIVIYENKITQKTESEKLQDNLEPIDE